MNELLLKILVPVISGSVKKAISSLKPDQISNEIDVTERIKTHLTEVMNWSMRLEYFGLSEAKNIQLSTVALSVETTPRIFRSPDDISPKIREEDILSRGGNILVLGDPGGGKTTTLKRIAYRLVTQKPLNNDDIYQYPIVVRLRDLHKGSMLLTKLASILGIEYRIEKIETEEMCEESEKIEDEELMKIGAKNLSQEKESKKKDLQELIDIGEKILLNNKNVYRNEIGIVKRRIIKKVTKIEKVPKVGTRLLVEVLADVFNKSSAIILLDGLDELEVSHKAILEKEVESLGRKLNSSKIIVTQRSGDHTQPLEGFDALNLCPLEQEQIQTISSGWFPDDDMFINELKTKPYKDLATRPLFLTHILVIFDKYKYLPERAKDIYEKIVILILDEWDIRRRIRRVSRYAGFSTEMKLEFLSKLSFHLTYKKKTKVFTHKDLVDCYNSIHQGFNLPSGEADKVANEIEMHTGLIVSFYGNNYEFSHLSLQEYLCARYLVSSPITPVLSDYIKSYSTPLAVAVSLSSEPGNWLAGLVLNPLISSLMNKENMLPFLSRLCQENPIFVKSEILGFAILNLISVFGIDKNSPLTPLLNWLYSIAAVKESVDLVAHKYYHKNILAESENFLQFDLKNIHWTWEDDPTLFKPENLFLRKEFAIKIFGN